MGIIEQFLRVIAPHQCIGCTVEGQLLCARCARSLPAVPSRCYRCQRPTEAFRTCTACYSSSSLFGVTPFTKYDGLAKEVIHCLKFERSRAAAEDIAEALATRLSFAGMDVVTYVPTAPARVRSRGYDQAQLIAKATAELAQLPCITLLARNGNLRQLGKDRATRHEQIQDAFYAVHSNLGSGRRVLLIDDVLTTGATCEAAAATLCQAGAKRVSAAVFAVA